jgi:hypothetical protein
MYIEKTETSYELHQPDEWYSGVIVGEEYATRAGKVKRSLEALAMELNYLESLEVDQEGNLSPKDLALLDRFDSFESGGSR